jgi:hypothetical protein
VHYLKQAHGVKADGGRLSISMGCFIWGHIDKLMSQMQNTQDVIPAKA